MASFFGALFFATTHGQAATLTVTSDDDQSLGSLRNAIAVAASGDTINFSLPPGSVINLTNGQLVIDKSLTIIGPGAKLLTVQRSMANGTGAFGIFLIVPGNPFSSINVGVSGLTIANGSSNDGGGIANFHNAISAISDCRIVSNRAGGGVGNYGQVTLLNTTVESNTSGGVSNMGGTLTVINSTVSGNERGIVNSYDTNIFGNPIFGTTNIINATVSGNSIVGVANVAYLFTGGHGTVNLKNTIIAGNSADVFGVVVSQGYNLVGNTGGATITGDTTGNQLDVDPLLGPLQDNGGPTPTHALQPGSPAVDKGYSFGWGNDQRGQLRPIDSPNIPNATGGDGSDIGAYEDQTVCQTVVTNNNDSGPGSLRGAIGAACVGGTVTFAPGVASPIDLTSGELSVLRPMTIVGPGANLMTVQRSASAGTNFRIFHVSSNGVATISGLTITKGNPNGDGGGFYVDNGSLLTLRSCAVTGNTLNRNGIITTEGGGLYNLSGTTVIINDSTISGNTSTGDGGGVSTRAGTLTIQRSTISANTAGGAGGGLVSEATCNVMSSTIANNAAGNSGGGLYRRGSALTIRNSIVAKNTAPGGGPDISNAVTSQGFNLIGNSSGSTITPAQPTDQIGSSAAPIDPLLGPLQDNGGPTQTRALLSGSTAIDKGHSNFFPTDQRGFLRPADIVGIPNVQGGDGSDIGAFEVQAAQATILANISTRLRVETGDNVLIGGFIITGTQPKKVIVRAIGPSLPLAGALADPVLELRNSSGGLIASNNNWRSDQESEIIATTIPPGNDLESAIVATLPANNAAYTAIVRGVNNGTGIGVVEAYDLDRTVDSKLGNISTRGLVQTGDNVLIGGLIVLGQDPLRVIVRAIGPSLPVAGALGDPTLELHDGNGALIASNDNWRSDQEAEIIATTVPPSSNLEAAIVRNLAPAAYTAIVRGANGTTGVAVVEAYALN